MQATDADSGVNSMVRYSVAGSNFDGVVFVNAVTGELTLDGPVSSAHTSRGQYEVTVWVTDLGEPPLRAEAEVRVRVGVPGNQRPVFRNASYAATIPENAARGSEVLRVRAADPDGPDRLIEYSMAAGDDNFRVDRRTGAVTVSERAVLDLDGGGGGHGNGSDSLYHLVVVATDGGQPVRETAHTDVYVRVTDVNDKPPRFERLDAGYIAYVPETAEVGHSVFRVVATDPDRDAAIRYAVVEPIVASDKTGLPLKNTSSYNYKEAFR